MKYIKLLRFDIRNGIAGNWGLFLAPVILAVFAFTELKWRVSALWVYDATYENFTLSYADCLVYTYGGMAKYIPNPTNPFQFPARWGGTFLLLFLFTLSYPVRDMHSFGQQVLIRSQSRLAWWLAKCTWNLLCSVLYHGLITLSLLCVCLATGADLAGEAHAEMLCLVFQTTLTGTAQYTAIPAAAFFLPAVASAAISLLQMTLSLFLRPVFSFLAVSVLMVSSAYYLTPFLPGNYAMFIRHVFFTMEGVTVSAGYYASVSLIAAAVLAGSIRFHRYDIIHRE